MKNLVNEQDTFDPNLAAVYTSQAPCDTAGERASEDDLSSIYAFDVDTTEHKSVIDAVTVDRKKNGKFTKLLGVSSIVMSMILPVGVVPRILQAKELDQNKAKAERQLPAVSTAPVGSAPDNRLISLPGAIEAVTETPVYARASGYISSRLADIGDKVSPGQLLAHIDTPDIDQSAAEAQAQVFAKIAGKAQREANRDSAKADLDRAAAQLSQARADLVSVESDLKLARITFVRFRQLGNDGAVSAQDVDEREAKLKTSTAAKQAAEDRIRAAQSSEIAAAARLKAEIANVYASDADINAAQAHANRSVTEKGFQNVVSPFSGVITERNIDDGALVTAGSENSKAILYRVARIDTVKVYVDVPQYAASGIRVGQTVSIKLKEFPGRKFEGEIARTSVALDPIARTLRTEIHVDNRQLDLKPGMYADVEISVPRTMRVFLIPANSLIVRSSGPQVLTVSRDKRAHYHGVTLGEDLGTEVEVVSGLTGKELLVINPPDSIAEGTPVAIN